MSLSKRSISGFPASSGSGSSAINTTSTNKVTLGLLRGKAITTSVPTIKFSAGAEEVVEMFSSCCEEELATPPHGASPKHERERSTTPVDPEQTLPSTNTPTSDPWRFFSGIKGKITKSVEGKLIEYKNKSAITSSTTLPETSPSKHQTRRTTNNSSSAGNSRSDSEDISESSLSKTQGGLSTTEGAEMSSTTDEDDEEEEDGTPSQSLITSEHSLAMQPSKQTVHLAPSSGTTSAGGLRYRLCTVRSGGANSTDTVITETTVGESFLRALQRLAGDNSEDNDNVRTEQGVDVLQDMETDGAAGASMEPLDLNIDNVTISSDDVIEVREVLGSDIRADLTKALKEKQSVSENIIDSRTIFNPTQFVDLRHLPGSIKTKKGCITSNERRHKIQRAFFATALFLVAYFILSPLSVYFSGFILGVVITLAVVCVRNKWLELTATSNTTPESDVGMACAQLEVEKNVINADVCNKDSIMTVWMNEWPAIYTPQTYSVAGTQPVHLRLQRHLLRVSNTNSRLPKRDMNQTIKQDSNAAAAAGGATYTYTRHRIYDLRGATVSLLPLGLTRIRWWSKKYPICVQLADLDHLTQQPINNDETAEKTQTAVGGEKVSTHQQVFKQVVRKRRKWHQYNNTKDSTIQFSKLMFDDMDGASSSSMIDMLDLAVPMNGDNTINKSSATETIEKDAEIELSETTTTTDDNNMTRLYLFARTCRDKETWYQLLTSATSTPTKESLSSSAIYQNYMDTILRLDSSPISSEPEQTEQVGTTSDNLIWLNALLGRAWYSYATGGEAATMRLKDRIQRKLATIRLPAFIEELKLSELSISAPKMFQKVPVQISWASRPLLDERGVWIDMDLEYESNVVLILQTKLNLMRLKSKGPTIDSGEQQCDDQKADVEYRSAIFHSDVDDSAESSSDDDSGGDSDKLQTEDSDPASSVAGGGTSATTGSPNHKLIRMVDRIADSRLFRAATEYRYVQRALENVRNTDLCLRVEVKSISGRLCVNLPPPPSDRLWFGFRATPAPPRLKLRALPTVGDYHISLQHVTGWLEKRLVREFHKVLVLPNMEDIVLPGLR